MISDIHNEISNRKNSPEVGLRGYYIKIMSFNSRSFLSTDLKFGSFIAKKLFKVQNIFSNFKNFLSYHDKIPPLSITKVLFRGFGCKIQTKRPFKKR